jgi:cobalamin-dependent methionine synthase I
VLDTEIDERPASAARPKRQSCEPHRKARDANPAKARRHGGTKAPRASVLVRRLDRCPVPTAPFWGFARRRRIDLDDIYPFINPVALFRGQWQVKKGAMSDAEYDAIIEDKVTPIFERTEGQVQEKGILQPKSCTATSPATAKATT